MQRMKRLIMIIGENRRYQVMFFIIAMGLIFLGYAGLRIKIGQNVAHRYTVVEDRDLIKHVEEISYNNDSLLVSGWCFYKDIESQNSVIQVFMRNVENEKDIVWLDMSREERNDVDEYYKCKHDYSNSGFRATTQISPKKAEGKKYEIFIKYTNNTAKGETSKKHVKTVSTGCYFEAKNFTETYAMGEPFYPQGISEELEAVLSQGKLLAERSDLDIYIYQIGKKVLWVAGKNFAFAEDGETKIQYQLGTTRADLLPNKRIRQGHITDNISFIFENNEIMDETYGEYRVSVHDIPTAYPITYILTGYYDEEWYWKEYITPDISVLVN